MKSTLKNLKNMHHIIIQRVVKSISIPSDTQMKHWVKTVLKEQRRNVEVTLRIVGKKEIQNLNLYYRKKNTTTNVLAFPFDDIDLPTPILGDIVLCAPVIKSEAKAQNKTEKAHWAHMIVHGLLHLLGYDHVQLRDAKRMEKKEVEILAKFKIKNPYQV